MIRAIHRPYKTPVGSPSRFVIQFCPQAYETDQHYDPNWRQGTTSIPVFDNFTVVQTDTALLATDFKALHPLPVNAGSYEVGDTIDFTIGSANGIRAYWWLCEYV